MVDFDGENLPVTRKIHKLGWGNVYLSRCGKKKPLPPNQNQTSMNISCISKTQGEK